MNLGRDELKSVLLKKGYDIKVMSPEWCSFAIQLLIVDLLSEIKEKIR